MHHHLSTRSLQIVVALNVIHDHNILHRDLKSQNVFLTQEDHVMVGDFGDPYLDDAQNRTRTRHYTVPSLDLRHRQRTGKR